MADHTFTYTDSTGVTTTLTFPRAFFQNDKRQKTPNQTKEISFGGTPMSENWGNGKDIQDFTVQVPKSSETLTDWTDIEDFVENKIFYSIEPFTWTDADGAALNVRMWNDSFEPTEYATYNQYTFQLLIIRNNK